MPKIIQSLKLHNPSTTFVESPCGRHKFRGVNLMCTSR